MAITRRPPRLTRTPSGTADEVDAGDVLGFEREAEERDPQKRAARRFREDTKHHFTSTGDHFKSLFNFDSIVEANQRKAIEEEARREAARKQFEEEKAKKEEEVRKRAVEKALEEEQGPKLQNPFSSGKRLGENQASTLFAAPAETSKQPEEQPAKEPRAADIALSRRRRDEASEQQNAATGASIDGRASETANNADPNESKTVQKRAKDEIRGANPVIVVQPSAATERDTANTSDDSSYSRGPEMSPEQERDTILARQNYERRIQRSRDEEQNPRLKTTNLAAATGSLPENLTGSSSPSVASAHSGVEQTGSINRSFNSPTTSIVGNESRTTRIETPAEAEQSLAREKMEIYERGAMLICTEPVRPGSDVAIVVSPTELNAESRYLLVCPIEKRNSPLNQPFAVDIPQHRGCFTVRCDWTRSIEVGMVSRVEQRQVPAERLAAIEEALRTATGLHPGQGQASPDSEPSDA